MLEGIGKFFTQIFQAIVGFFQGLFGLRNKDSAAAPPAAGAATEAAPEGQARSQAVSTPASSQPTPAATPDETLAPLVDDETRQTIRDALSNNRKRSSVADTFPYNDTQDARAVLESNLRSAERTVNQYEQVRRSIGWGQSIGYIQEQYGISEQTILDSMDSDKVAEARLQLQNAQGALQQFDRSQGSHTEAQRQQAQQGRSALNPRDPTIGTDAAPIFDHDDQGRLIVNMPQNARVEIRQSSGSVAMPGRETMYTVKVSPNQMPSLNDPNAQGDFAVDELTIPGSVLENGQAIFRAPSVGQNTIQAYGLPAGTTLIGESEGATIKNRGVDAIVNGRLQTDSANETQARRRPAPPPRPLVAPPQAPRRAPWEERNEHIMENRAQINARNMRNADVDMRGVMNDRANDIRANRNYLTPNRPYRPHTYR